MIYKIFTVIPPKISVKLVSAIIAFTVCFTLFKVTSCGRDGKNDVSDGGVLNSDPVQDEPASDAYAGNADITSVFDARNAETISGQISAASAILCRINGDAVNCRKNERESIPSEVVLTLATALTVMSAVNDGLLSPYDRAVCPAAAARLPEYYSTASILSVGQSLTVSELVRCMFCTSPQVFAYVLAIHTSGSEQAFVERMNAYLYGIGIRDTVFISISDLTVQSSNAYDGAVILRETVKNPALFEMLASSDALVLASNGSAWNTVTLCNKFYSECCTQAQARADGITAGYYLLSGGLQYVYMVFETGGEKYISFVCGSATGYADSLILRSRV